MSNTKKNMDVQVIWNIRDARGFTTYEKAFLFVIASRGTARTLRKTLLNDLSCSTGQLSKVVNSLRDKNVINVHEGFWVDGKKTQTEYSINAEVLEAYVPVRSQDEQGSSPHEPVRSLSEQGSSLHERGSSHSGGYKGTKKETVKVTVKETKKQGASVAIAPSLPNDLEEEVNEMTYQYLGSLNVDDFEDFSLTKKALGFYEENTKPVSPNLEWETPVLPPKKETKKKDFTKIHGTGKAKSSASLKEQIADVRNKVDQHLETTIRKNRLTDAQAQQARNLYADETWRPDKKGYQRVMLAVLESDKEVD